MAIFKLADKLVANLGIQAEPARTEHEARERRRLLESAETVVELIQIVQNIENTNAAGALTLTGQGLTSPIGLLALIGGVEGQFEIDVMHAIDREGIRQLDQQIDTFTLADRPGITVDSEIAGHIDP